MYEVVQHSEIRAKRDGTRFLIVDGYNIIGAWPELSKLKDTDLEGARDKLIHMLAEYQSFSGMKVYLVFDAYMVPGLGKKYVQNKLARPLYQREGNRR